MRIAVAFAVVICAALAGCGLARDAENKRLTEERRAAYAAEIAAAEADYAAKRISFGQMVARAADARIAQAPNDPLAAEEAYFAKLQGSRVDRGEISVDEYRYAVAKHLSDVASRRQARAVNALTAAAAIQASQPPKMNCTSNRVGTFTYTNCN